MPTRRGWSAFAAGLAVWVAARFTGSPDLHILAAGITVLPILAIGFVRWSKVRLEVHRHLSAVRMFAGSRVTVTLTLENLGRTTTSFLLLEDGVPASLGRPARLVMAGIPPRNQQSASYTLSCRHRGRYTLGPLAVFLSDPFGLARTRMTYGVENELVVYPQVEELEGRPLVSRGAGTGESAVRQLYRSAADFYTMRSYVTGDDLRRIHWPSVARTGELMIRQDEATRRSAAVVFLDNRVAALGHRGSPAFERGVSAAASIALSMGRTGLAMRFASVDRRPDLVSEEDLLEILASATHAKTRTLTEALLAMRSSALADTTLAFVSSPPRPAELGVIIKTGSAFGRKLGVFVTPVSLSTLSPDARNEMETRIARARAALQRAGWEVHIIQPEGGLAESWRRSRISRLQPAGTSS